MAYKEIIVSDIRIKIYIPDHGFDTAIYIPFSDIEEINSIVDLLEQPDLALIAVECKDWNDLLTPWPASAAFKGNPDFGGHAETYLSMFRDTIIPVSESVIGRSEFRGITGYSLAGLFALYSFYSTDLFSLCGCVSGSVWYDGFEEWVLSREPVPESGSVFFSLGNKEEKTRNPLMQHTGQIMRNIADHLNDSDSYEASFRYTKGNHFEGHTQRMSECLRWLIGM